MLAPGASVGDGDAVALAVAAVVVTRRDYQPNEAEADQAVLGALIARSTSSARRLSC